MKKSISISEALNWAAGKISSLEAEILLAHLLKVERIFLYKNPDYHLQTKDFSQYKKLIQRRKNGEPLPYITNHQEFFGLDFYVDKRVLIPRPETEILVEEVINQIQNENVKCKIVDVGTGSGCISVAIATKLKVKKEKLKIYATDISKKALKVAKINAEKHKVSNKITFLDGNLLDVLPEKVDMIVANIPYVATDYFKFPDFDDINPYEPDIAFFAGKDGLDLIKKLLKQASKYLNKGGGIFLEISYHQKKPLEKIIPKYLPKATFLFKKDLASLDRLVVIRA